MILFAVPAVLSPVRSLPRLRRPSASRVRSHAPGASSADIADAIDFAIEDGVDVINLSLGARTKSFTIEQAIQRAGDTRLCRGKACVLHDAGIVCCCAAGNDNSTVSYPAALNIENVVSVAVESHGEASASPVCSIGKFGTYPKDSAHTLAETNKVSRDGQFFRYEKSNFGDVDGDGDTRRSRGGCFVPRKGPCVLHKVDVCAPAVAVETHGEAAAVTRLAKGKACAPHFACVLHLDGEGGICKLGGRLRRACDAMINHRGTRQAIAPRAPQWQLPMSQAL